MAGEEYRTFEFPEGATTDDLRQVLAATDGCPSDTKPEVIVRWNGTIKKIKVRMT